MAYSAYRCYLTPLGALLLFSFLSSLPFNYLRCAEYIYALTATLYMGRFRCGVTAQFHYESTL